MAFAYPLWLRGKEKCVVHTEQLDHVLGVVQHDHSRTEGKREQQEVTQPEEQA